MDILTANIADPTDFADTNLQSLDRSLRCNICGDLFDAPVTLQCGHAFCSLVSMIDLFCGFNILVSVST